MVTQLTWANFYTRIPLLVWSVIALGTTAEVRRWMGPDARVNLGIAAAVETLILSVGFPCVWLFLGYSKLTLLIYDFVCFVLNLAAAASINADLDDYCGYANCSTITAAVAFLYMSWINILALIGLEAYEVIADRRSGGGAACSSSMWKFKKSRPDPGHGAVSEGAVPPPEQKQEV